MYLQSKAGFPVHVSSRFVPLTNQLKQTLNMFAGEEIYLVSHEFHGKISLTPEIKVAVPVKPRRLSYLDRARDEWTQQSSAIIDLEGQQPSYDGYGSTEYYRTYYKRGRNDKYKKKVADGIQSLCSHSPRRMMTDDEWTALKKIRSSK